ncbi:hypothetical protein [Botrimarina hoheduenensis]|uniref:Chromosome partition protein Smc n=1 Tax=Botrimarina hoheduenensis TaxID=2528000 RepID=A0A5C5VYV7_9BACT|nr:hypothetical protein [Botrimarina hoheduenensis]TWT43287.1 hypothetical protein Pla111_22380 [Botrimarina hoheduenensis]
MPASVRSFDAIRRVREEVQRFGLRVSDGLIELEAEIRRVIDWVEHDRPGYWKERTRRAYDEVGTAKAELHRCLMYPINDEQPSCAEQRAALKRAEGKLAYCREKQELVSRLAHKLRHELHEYQGRTAALREAIDIDTPRTAASLARMVEVLESYARTGPASTSGSSASPPAETSAEVEAPASDEPVAEEPRR